jgi:hypothetical protein
MSSNGPLDTTSPASPMSATATHSSTIDEPRSRWTIIKTIGIIAIVVVAGQGAEAYLVWRGSGNSGNVAVVSVTYRQAVTSAFSVANSTAGGPWVLTTALGFDLPNGSGPFYDPGINARNASCPSPAMPGVPRSPTDAMVRGESPYWEFFMLNSTFSSLGIVVVSGTAQIYWSVPVTSSCSPFQFYGAHNLTPVELQPPAWTVVDSSVATRVLEPNLGLALNQSPEEGGLIGLLFGASATNASLQEVEWSVILFDCPLLMSGLDQPSPSFAGSVGGLNGSLLGAGIPGNQSCPEQNSLPNELDLGNVSASAVAEGYQYTIPVDPLNGGTYWNALTYSIQDSPGSSAAASTVTSSNLSVTSRGSTVALADSSHLGWQYDGTTLSYAGEDLVLQSSTNLKGLYFQLNEDGLPSNYIDVPLG